MLRLRRQELQHQQEQEEEEQEQEQEEDRLVSRVPGVVVGLVDAASLAAVDQNYARPRVLLLQVVPGGAAYSRDGALELSAVQQVC